MINLSGFKNSPACAAHQQNFGHCRCHGIPSCSRSKIICCSENEPSGSGRHVEHDCSNEETRLSSKNALAGLSMSILWPTSPALAAATSTYTPSPMEPGWEIYAGFIAGVVPFIIASYEFGKRILIQRRCPECRGSGLVQRGRVLRKCTQCGGMLPWLGWKMFFFSTIKDPGNGGPLNQPKGQKSIFYSVPAPLKVEANLPTTPEREKSENREEKASISNSASSGGINSENES